MPIAEVNSYCGRSVLHVAGVAVAMEGDACRHNLPDEVAEPIPADELEHAMIGDKLAKDLPLDVVRFFRGERWRPASLKWVATVINEAVEKACCTLNERKGEPCES